MKSISVSSLLVFLDQSIQIQRHRQQCVGLKSYTSNVFINKKTVEIERKHTKKVVCNLSHSQFPFALYAPLFPIVPLSILMAFHIFISFSLLFSRLSVSFGVFYLFSYPLIEANINPNHTKTFQIYYNTLCGKWNSIFSSP